MDQDKVKRKLTTILSAEVKGYSRLIGEDEAWMLRTLNSYKGLIRNLAGEHRGPVVVRRKNHGCGVSVVTALHSK